MREEVIEILYFGVEIKVEWERGIERRERSRAEMYIEGRVRLYESTRWITINCCALALSKYRILNDVLCIQALIFGKRYFVVMSGV